VYVFNNCRQYDRLRWRTLRLCYLSESYFSDVTSWGSSSCSSQNVLLNAYSWQFSRLLKHLLFVMLIIIATCVSINLIISTVSGGFDCSRLYWPLMSQIVVLGIWGSLWPWESGLINSTVLFLYIPYILAYKSQNLRPNLDQKVGRATYTRVIKKEIFTTGRTGLTETCQDTDTPGE